MRGRALLIIVIAACGEPLDPVMPIDAGADAIAASCADGVKNGTETDVDCGGTCNACADGDSCEVGRDCANGTCFAGTCADRMWVAESSGTTVAVPGTQTWIAAPGASVQVQLYGASTVFIRWSGSSRYVGGGNAICHLGQRFVIDGVPTGNPTWGNAIMVQRGTTRWHDPFHVELAVQLDAGMHTIAAEMTNASGYATCNLDGDGGLAYDRSRLMVAAYEPSDAWSAESTAGTGPLGGPSPWTDIPGVALSIPLEATKLVQFSLAGTQLSGSGTTAHCAYRLIVDNSALGDPNQGQAISVGDIGGGWWAPVALKWGIALNAGTHTVRAQVRNSGGATGTCNAGEGNNDYAKFRLFASASASAANLAVESTGASQYLASNSAWTLINGLDTNIHTGARPGNVQIELAGTQRTVSGSGHCAYRIVLDGVPLGDPNHGQSIDVGDGTNAWWSYVGLTWGTKLAAGAHTLKIEVRNSGTSGDCGVNGDNLPYGRVRMLVRSL